MNDFKQDMAQIQTLVGNAFTSTGGLVAMADGGAASNVKLQMKLEETMGHFEQATLELRTLCERNCPGTGGYGKKPLIPARQVTGLVEIIGYSWLHICLNTLLPHCRYQSPAWLSDTVRRLLDDYEAGGNPLPFYGKRALMIIDEHSNIDGRKIYDQDNKGWKAVSNVLKGRIIPDDDQYSLGVSLLSTRSEENSCHIILMDMADAGDYFALSAGDYAFGSIYQRF